MCGIIGYNGNKDPKNVLLDGLKRLEYRGYDSAGIAILEKDGIEVFRVEGRIQNLEKKLGTQSFKGHLGVGHTRWATHGAPTEINAHPHRVGSITLVHNGIIENYLELKTELVKAGRKILSDTDSEIVAHLFDMEVSSGDSLEKAIPKVLPKLRGSYAFVIISELEPKIMYGVRNGAPLLVGLGDSENFVASDVQAVLHRTNKIIYLEDHEFAVCKSDNVEVRDRSGRIVTRDFTTIHWTPDQLEKAGYRHYMLKEIHEQPQAIANTIGNHFDQKTGIIELQELKNKSEFLKTLKRISIVACGTARHAALIGKYYLERFARIPVDVDFGSEFRYRDPILDKDSLVVCVSQSGETADTLAALKEAKKQNIPGLAICNVRESTLARDSDFVVYTNAGPEIGVASTKAFTTQLTVLYMLAVHLGYLRGALSANEAKELSLDILKLPFLVDRVLEQEKHIEKIAVEYQDTNFFFFMGRDVNYPIALEGALKLKEISYAHAEGYPAGELKHGPIALVDRQAAVIVLAPTDLIKNEGNTHLSRGDNTLHEKIMSNLQEVKSRGGSIFNVATETDKVFQKEGNFFIGLPEAPWALNPILLSIPMQLFAYHIANLRGTDVDKPRNLAKSVTVE